MREDGKKKVVVLIPTFNEKDNIQPLIREILSLPLVWDLAILVVDDNSPDGTGLLAKSMETEEPRVKTIIREKRRGRGTAGIDGFKIALTLNPDYVIEMDGDFSHHPRFIPALLDSCETSDIVLGSRFVRRGKDSDRWIARRFITYLARSFIRRQLKTSIKDPSSGFRCFRKESLKKIDLDDLISTGPSLVLEILYKALLLNLKITEIPIVFSERSLGKTKLNLLTLVETWIMALKFKRLYGPLRLKGKT